MFSQKGPIDYDLINVKTVKAYIYGDPKPKTLKEIQSYLNKTIKVDINIQGTHKLSELLKENQVEIQKGA